MAPDPYPLACEMAATNIHNHATTQNQASNQAVHGSQIFGNVTVYSNSSVADEHDPKAGLRQDILASLAFPGMLDRRDNVAQPHHNTCNWILDLQEYHSWRISPRGLLWIKGKPGSGKSTMMSFLYRRMRQERAIANGIHLDFFFTARGSKLQYSQLGMVRSLLNQLLCQCPSAYTTVETPYQDKCSAFGRSACSWEWQQPELERLFSDAIVAASQHSQITIFLDALDEAGEQAAPSIARYIHRINDRVMTISDNQNSNLKFCISSRHYPVISMVKGSEIWMEDHNRNDIKLFIDVELDLGTRASGCDRSELRDWHRLLLNLLEHANGVFQWVRLILPILSNALEEGWTFEEANRLLKEIPQDLEDVYMHILQVFIKQRFNAQSFLLFQWAILAQRPLSVTEMMHALVSSSYDPCTPDPNLTLPRMRKRISSLSGGLIEISGSGASPDDLTVQVIHQTVREFMLRKGLKMLYHLQQGLDPSSKFEPEWDSVALVNQCHATLYWCCLTYLDKFSLEASRSDVTSYSTNLDGLYSIFPFIGYTTKFLFEHARRASSAMNMEDRCTDWPKEYEVLQRICPMWIKMWQKYSGDSMMHPSCSLFHIAAHLGLISLLEDLINEGGQSNPENDYGYTPLHLASSKGYLDICELLYQAGARVNILPKRVDPPLHLATIGGHLRVVTWLLEKGAKVNKRGTDGATPLHEAAQHGHSTIVDVLLRNGANVNVLAKNYGTALHVAVRSSDKDIVQILVRAGSDPNIESRSYGTALQYAASFGHKDIVQILVNAGADANTRDTGTDHVTALYAAARSGHDDTVRTLLDAGANVDAESGTRGTALQSAASSGSKDVVQMLVEAGANLNIQNYFTRTALQSAAKAGHKDIVQILLDAGADPNLHHDRHATALQSAVQAGHKDIVQILVDAGADPNIQKYPYSTALWYAVKAVRKDIVKILIDAGADIVCYHTSSTDINYILANARASRAPGRLKLKASSKGNLTDVFSLINDNEVRQQEHGTNL